MNPKKDVKIKMIEYEDFCLNYNDKTLSTSMIYVYKHVSIVILSAEPFQLLLSRPDQQPSDAFPDSILFMLSSKLKTLQRQLNNVLATSFLRRYAISEMPLFVDFSSMLQKLWWIKLFCYLHFHSFSLQLLSAQLPLIKFQVQVRYK